VSAMAPKRKAAKSTSKDGGKKAKKAETPEAEEPVESPATSKAVEKGGKFTVADAWTAAYLSNGVMTQEGFSEVCGRIQVEEMSFEACYLMYLLMPSTEDAMVVCKSKADLQRGVEQLGCRLLSEVPAKLRSKKAAMRQYDMGEFQPFYRWMFEMGKSISAMKTGAHVGVVRSVPVEDGLQLMEVVLGSWSFFGKLKQFCTEKMDVPFSKDLWAQIGRFAHLTTTGLIAPDLSNYEDDGSGGGSAWPCVVDDFVEWVQAAEQ